MLLCFAMRGSAHELHKLVEPVLGLDFLDPGYRSILLAAALACLLTLLDRSGITQTTAHLESPTPEFRHGIPVFYSANAAACKNGATPYCLLKRLAPMHIFHPAVVRQYVCSETHGSVPHHKPVSLSGHLWEGFVHNSLLAAGTRSASGP